MVRKTVAVVGAVLVGWLLLGAPASAATCSDVPPEDVPFPATCIDGEWVGTDDGFGFGDEFDEEFQDGEREVKTLAIIGFAVVLTLGIGGAIWRVNAARGMARRAGMNEDDAANVALLGGNGLEAAYLASAFRPGQDPGQAAGEAGAPDTATRLAELQRLRDQGLITYDEYEAQRRTVIEDI